MMVWTVIKEFIPSWFWKAVASLFVAFVVFKSIEHRGAEKALAKAKDATHVKVDTAKRASAAVPTDGAADRLRRDYCPDCR
jgi:hypothetical protein